MKQTIKRALSLALALALSVTILLPSAWAEGESEAKALNISISACKQIGSFVDVNDEDIDYPVYLYDDAIPAGATTVIFSDFADKMTDESSMIAALNSSECVTGTNSVPLTSDYSFDGEEFNDTTSWSMIDSYKSYDYTDCYAYWIIDDNYDIYYFIIKKAAASQDEPFRTSVGEILSCEKNGYSYTNYGETTPQYVDLYTVKLPFGTQSVVLSFQEECIAYSYNEDGEFIAACGEYGDGRTGHSKATATIGNNGMLPDFIRVQTPYDSVWQSTTLYAVKFEYNYTFKTSINGEELADITFMPNAYSYYDYATNKVSTVGVYTVKVPEDAETVDFQFSDNCLAYNYTKNGVYLSGWYADCTVGSKQTTITIDASSADKPADSEPDYIQIQTPYVGYDSTLLYVVTFDWKSGNLNTPDDPNVSKADMAALIENIAKNRQTVLAGANPSKVVIDMAAYEKYVGTNSYTLTDAEKQNYINTAISRICDETATGSTREQNYTLSIVGLQSIGVNPRVLYLVNSNTAIDAITKLNSISHTSDSWTAPYTFAAYNQGDYGTDTVEQDLIQRVIENQNANGSWYDADSTANMISGLAFYYQKNQTVTDAIDKAIGYLSEQQNDNGSFGVPDADSTANVIMALASVGINPDTDARFIKNGNSALDGLLSFALTDNSGFGYQDNTTVNGYATEEAFRALIAAAQVMKTGEAYNIYDFSGNDVQPGRATGEGEVQKPSAPPEENDNITVTFSMKADTGYWVSPKSVTVKEGSTVYHVFTAALQNTGITYVGAENGYVSSITKDGKTLAEFTNGPDSGWLYKVNGELPDVGLTSYEVSNGDNIVWYYTNDWTKDSLAGQSAKPAEETITTTTTANSDGTITVTVTQGKETLDNVSGGVKVELPNKSGTGDVIVLVNKDGSETIVTKSLVEDETVYALLDGTCTVKIIDNAKDFSDISDTAWYADAVDFVSGHELYNGTGNGAFSPNAPMSRAMLATVLYRLESEPESASDILAGFNDGADVSAWAQEGLSWAVANKVLEGTDDNCLAPNETVTREQLAVMIYRYAKLYGMDMTVSASTDISGQGVSSWAETAMAWAVENGIIEGGTGGKLNPQGPASRAEVAAILQRLVAVMVK